MWNLVKQYIGMVRLKMESKYLQELTSIKLNLLIIQELTRW